MRGRTARELPSPPAAVPATGSSRPSRPRRTPSPAAPIATTTSPWPTCPPPARPTKIVCSPRSTSWSPRASVGRGRRAALRGGRRRRPGADPAARRSRRRPHPVQAGVFGARRRGPGGVSGSARLGRVGRRLPADVDLAAVGRRRGGLLRRARHRSADPGRRLQRRSGRPDPCRTPPLAAPIATTTSPRPARRRRPHHGVSRGPSITGGSRGRGLAEAGHAQPRGRSAGCDASGPTSRPGHGRPRSSAGAR